MADANNDDLAAVGRRVNAVVRSEQATLIVARFFAELQGRAARHLADGTVFLVTGDIPAMWLRDSAAQLMPLLRVGGGPQAEQFAVAVLRRQLEYIRLDPYANAFNPRPNGAGHHRDLTEPSCPRHRAWVWERKYEVDSLCYPLLVAYRIWRRYGRADIFDPRFWGAVERILHTWETEQDHERLSAYRFRRPRVPVPGARSGALPSVFAGLLPGVLGGPLARGGRGPEVAVTGMTWSGFRPSDDPVRYGYNVPGNLFASAVLGRLAEIAVAVRPPRAAELLTRIRRLRGAIDTGVARYALVDDPRTGQRWAYEVDGRGGALEMDDANLPSLLALPLLGCCRPDDPVYTATREFVLSERNPYYFRGPAARGVGSPHTPRRHVWPLAIAAAALTSTDPADRRAAIDTLLNTHAGTTRIHESFHADRPATWTRAWFSWAEAMFCELVLDHCGYRHSDAPSSG
ncbi:glycoside hydrolase family 125 protein [Actinocrinis puniceicyclus]|uniref:Glycoside hydrolase family 125 protein n=1 Tax=Actinocrinis puniceicyclus TaxID=977794 RepID=A0A8J8BB49_9ACTN|nr:glycoside hydrolase family 125 protein [Actinocrinis puniceicyclus]MBS2962738.1 glycoside hydrolase family 125 protein [Actinocrinis puniceicyclus]